MLIIGFVGTVSTVYGVKVSNVVAPPALQVSVDDNVFERKVVQGDVVLKSRHDVYKCEGITGRLIVDEAYDGTAVSHDQFPFLTRVDGGVTILSNKQVESVDLEKLEVVGGEVNIKENSHLKKLKFDKLEKLSCTSYRTSPKNCMPKDELCRQSSFNVMANHELENVEVSPKLNRSYVVRFENNKFQTQDIFSVEELVHEVKLFKDRYARALKIASKPLYGILKDDQEQFTSAPKFRQLSYQNQADPEGFCKMPSDVVKNVSTCLQS